MAEAPELPPHLDCVVLNCPQALFLVGATEEERERDKAEARALGWWIWSAADVDTDLEGMAWCPAHAPRYAPRPRPSS